jgi:hypothetical protein
MALRIKNNAARGGVIENVHARNITVGQVGQAAISIDFYYEEGEKGGHTPVVRNVSVENMKTEKSKYAVYLRGFKDDPIDGISLVNCEFNGVAQGNVLENVADLYVRDVRINGAKVQRLT